MFSADLGRLTDLISSEKSEGLLVYDDQNRRVQSGNQKADNIQDLLSKVRTIEEFSSIHLSPMSSRTYFLLSFTDLRVPVFDLVVNDRSKLVMNGITVVNLNSRANSLFLQNCRVLHLKVVGSTDEIVLQNCEVGRLEVAEDIRINSIRVSGGSIAELWLPQTIMCRDISFEGRVKFSTKIIPKTFRQVFGNEPRNIVPKPDRNSFAILHDWAVKSGNSAVAHVARGNELALERYDAVGFERLLLNAWRIICNFGLSPARPLIWMLALYSALVVVLLASGTEPGMDSSYYNGWRSKLLPTKEANGAVPRALVGAAEGLLSPLSVFSPRKLVVPTSPWISALQSVLNYAYLVLIFLFGLSVRRRFKVG